MEGDGSEIPGLTGYCKQEIQRKRCRLYLRADRLLWRLGGKEVTGRRTGGWEIEYNVASHENGEGGRDGNWELSFQLIEPQVNNLC